MTTAVKNRIKGNGAAKTRATETKEPERKLVVIPPLLRCETTLMLIGDRPLLTNNKFKVAAEISRIYSGPGGKDGTVKPPEPTDDEKYAWAFYDLPSSKYEPPHPKGKYGVPASGIKKCVCAAIRTAGITDNTAIGLLANSFWVMADEGGLCQIQFARLERDIRPVNIGSKQKTVPQMRHRPMFHDWRIRLRIKYNRTTITEEMLVNLLMHAGQYIGLCEMRAQKKQGECGGFVVEGTKRP